MSLALLFLFFLIHSCTSAVINGVLYINPCDAFLKTVSIREGDTDDPPALCSTL